MNEQSYDSYQGLNVYGASIQTPKKPLLGGKYLIFSDQAAKGEVIVVTAFVPWAKTITGAGDGAEELSYISPDKGDGFFLFQPLVDGGAPKWSTGYVQSAAQNLASATVNDTKTSSGITTLSNTVQRDVAGMRDGWPLFVVAPGQKLNVVFNLVPNAKTGAIDQRYSIGGTVSGTKSINYAGVAIAGRRMSKDWFDRVAVERGW